MQSADPQRPFMVTVIPATPAPERTVADVVVGALGVAGSLMVVALVLGVLFGGVRLAWRRRYPPEQDHMPQVKPKAQDGTSPPSAPTR